MITMPKIREVLELEKRNATTTTTTHCYFH